MEYEYRGSTIGIWEPFVWEYSSSAVVFLLVPFILMFDEHFPISSKSWLKRLLVHIPLSIVFSFVHIVGMVGVRKAIYQVFDATYIFTDLDYAIIYEYRKDVMAYITILIVIYAYREILRLRNGEAQFEEHKSDNSEEKRILVSKSGIFHFIDPLSVDWVEAAGNYVELHVGQESYMLRATMKEIENRLGDRDFVRIHRSTIIRRDKIEKILPAMNGDKIIVTGDGEELRLSRRYRENLMLTN